MGCVTPWLSTGDWRVYVVNAQRRRSFDVLFVCALLPADDRILVFDNYQAGCRLLLLELDAK